MDASEWIKENIEVGMQGNINLNLNGNLTIQSSEKEWTETIQDLQKKILIFYQVIKLIFLKQIILRKL